MEKFGIVNTDVVADLCNMHPRTISRKIKELKEKGYINRVGRKFIVA